MRKRKRLLLFIAVFMALLGSVSLQAKQQAVIDTALLNSRISSWTKLPYNATSVVANPSFEANPLSGWTNPNSIGRATNGNINVFRDGSAYVEKWVSNPGNQVNLSFTQVLTDLPNGIYKVTAAAHAIQQTTPNTYPGKAYLIANTDSTEVFNMNYYSVKAVVTDNTLKIGFVTKTTGNWVALDNFQLSYLGTTSKSVLKSILDSANIVKTNTPDGDKLKIEYVQLDNAITAAQAVYDNVSATSAEIAAQETALNDALSLKVRRDTWKVLPYDATAAIVNPSFEKPMIVGWTNVGSFNPQNNTGLSSYKNGTWFVEKWMASGNHYGLKVSQVVKNIPNGIYMVTAGAMANNTSGTLAPNAYIFANDKKTMVSLLNNYSVTAKVTDNTLNIGYSCDTTGNWVAVDNFRLSYISDGSPFVIATPETLMFDPNNLTKTFVVSGDFMEVNATLTAPAGITLDKTTLTPAEIIAGTTVTATYDNLANIAKGKIAVTCGNATDTVVVNASADNTCFTKTYADQTNLITDPYLNSLSTYAGWGTKEITPLYKYCGLNSAKVIGKCGGSLDFNLTPKIAGNKTYRIRAMVSTNGTGESKIGISGATDALITMPFSTAAGEWKVLDFTFTTKATITSANMYMNSCETQTATESYVDNWEMYDVTAFDDRLKSLTISTGTLKPAFSPEVTSYKVELPMGVKSVQVAASTFMPFNYMAGLDSADLKTGLDTVKIKITSKDSLHTKTYTVYFRALTMKHSYTFEQGAYTDTTVIDMVGTLNGKRNGTKLTIANGAATVTGSTSSTSGYISFDAAALALNKYSAITLEGFIKAGNAENVNKYTMMAYFGSSTAGNKCLWQQLTRGNEDIAFTETNNGSSTVTVRGPELDDAAKHHVLSTLTADSIFFFIDGQLKEKKALTSNNFISSLGTNFACLFKGVWNDNNWNGSIYEYNIYDGIMDPAVVKTRADEFLSKSASTLSAITPSTGTLIPAFNPLVKEYALEVNDTASITVAATATYNVANVTGAGAFKPAAARSTVNIHVVSQDSTSVSDYKVHVYVKDTTCFVPLYATGNLITDPKMSDLTKYAGWGSKSVVVNPAYVYCGPTSVKISGKCGGSLDFNLTPVITGNRTYRVKAIVSTNGTGEAKIGISGATASNITVPFKTAAGVWQVLEFTFTTKATITSANMYLNSCESQTATESYIDNYELYDITQFDAHLNSLTLSAGTLKPAFSPAVTEYNVSIPEGIDSLSVTPVAVVPQAVVTGGGKIKLHGLDTVRIKVKAVNGIDSLTYKVYVKTLIRKHSYTFEANSVTDTTVIDVAGDLNGKRFGTATVENGAFVSKTNGDYIQFDAAKLAINKYYAITTEAFIRAGNKTNPGWTIFSYFGGGWGDNAYLTTIARDDNTSRTELVGGAIVPGPELEDGNLHHLVSVLTNDTLAFYLDGELLGKAKNTKPISNINTTNAWLCKGGWPDPTWNGSIYEFNIFEGTMSADVIAQRAVNFVGASNSRLSGITLDAGTLMPAFNPMITEYAAVLPAGKTSVNITATPKYSISKVKGAGIVNLVGGVATDTIKVTSMDSTTVTKYIVYASIADTSCFVPLYATGNIVTDRAMTDLSKFGGWGGKELNVKPENVYCGGTSGAVVKNGSIDVVTTGIFKANTTYRIKAMVKTSVGAEFQIGVWGYAAGSPDINNKFKTEGKWLTVDFTMTTGATMGSTQGIFFNNWACVGNNVDGSAGYIDNWEVYEVATANSVQVKYVDATGNALKDARSYKTTNPLGSLVVATAADKAEILVGDQRYQFDEVSVDTFALVSGENIMTLKFKNVTALKDMFAGKVKVNVINGTLKVYLNTDKTADYNVDLFGVQGNIIATQQDMEVAGQNELSFNLPVNGVYLVKISSGDKTAVYKVVK